MNLGRKRLAGSGGRRDHEARSKPEQSARGRCASPPHSRAGFGLKKAVVQLEGEVMVGIGVTKARLEVAVSPGEEALSQEHVPSHLMPRIQAIKVELRAASNSSNRQGAPARSPSAGLLV